MATTIEILPFPDDKRIAVTTSWDDGRVYDRRIVAAFNEWGLKGTFNLNSSLLSRTGHPLPEESRGYLEACEVRDLFAGHEVAVHSATHPHLPRLDHGQIAAEVLDDRRALEDLVGYPVRGMAYPFGTYNTRVIEVLRSLGIVYRRTTENRDPCFPPAEPLAWASTMHQFSEQPSPLPDRWEQFYAGKSYGKVFYVWGTATSSPIATIGARWSGSSSLSPAGSTSGTARTSSCSITRRRDSGW
jgi:peptidoglycan/xylan/chitin deacetylase (PgdA/CDA1 family)